MLELAATHRSRSLNRAALKKITRKVENATMCLLENFFQSDNARITEKMVPANVLEVGAKTSWKKHIAASHYVAWANRVWKLMQQEVRHGQKHGSHQIGVTHEAYLKHFQMQGVKIGRVAFR